VIYSISILLSLGSTSSRCYMLGANTWASGAEKYRRQPTIGATYGYARVSTEEQNEDRQLIALRQAGVDDSKIFVDHKSGKDFLRPSWRKLTRHLRRGDLLIITSIDRLGRNYNDILAKKGAIILRWLTTRVEKRSPDRFCKRKRNSAF